MEKYIHKVQYYETDKMGITHHSNYIRWMEEARVDFLDRIGFGYAKLEEDGIMSPVIGIECDYKNSTTFDDVIEIEVGIEEFKGVKLIIKYTKEVLECAIEAGGTTIRSYSSVDGVHGLFQRELYVHSKEGEKCGKCNSLIEKIKVGGRGTYYCPNCQKID